MMHVMRYFLNQEHYSPISLFAKLRSLVNKSTGRAKLLFLLVLSQILLFVPSFSQINEPYTIHLEESEYYGTLGQMSTAQYDSLNCLHNTSVDRLDNKGMETRELNRRVFGYHPYWMGGAWHNYRWDLLSDLCYFSYEVDPSTGNAVTIHDFMTDAVIDTALAKGVKVHLCVTLFSDHSSFFNSASSQQALINNLILLVTSRGIQGINIDFEAVPSSQSAGLTSFIQTLSMQLQSELPAVELSIASPAVNWNNTFDITALTPWLDFYMVMTYDYYYGGSSLAGPVSGFWPLTSSFNYSVSHSITYYQSKGVEPGKLILGVPYYGREWPVQSNTLPAQTTGSGVSLTYRQIVGGGNSHYIPANLYWDYRSYNPYYSYDNSGWNQCFFDNTRSLGLKYNFVNRRLLGGIGIWALGYDNGRNELWNLIEEKFTGVAEEMCRDTLYDNGGPWWGYKNNEIYTETVKSAYDGPLSIDFTALSLESGYDSLWVYDGGSVNAPLLAAISGTETGSNDEINGVNSILSLSTSSNIFTIQFKSDSINSRAGYELVWSCPTASIREIDNRDQPFSVFPNPVQSGRALKVSGINDTPESYQLIYPGGKIISIGKLANGQFTIPHNISGVVIVRILGSSTSGNYKLLVTPGM